MSKHTPGPWRVEAPDQYHPHSLSVRGPIGNWTIRCTEPKSGAGRGCSPHWYGWVGNETADATLIAAAPELAEALHNCCNIIGQALRNKAWGKRSTDEWDSAEEVESVLDSARAALAKAGVK